MATDRYEILEEELDPNYEPSREEILEKLDPGALRAKIVKLQDEQTEL